MCTSHFSDQLLKFRVYYLQLRFVFRLASCRSQSPGPVLNPGGGALFVVRITYYYYSITCTHTHAHMYVYRPATESTLWCPVLSAERSVVLLSFASRCRIGASTENFTKVFVCRTCFACPPARFIFLLSAAPYRSRGQLSGLRPRSLHFLALRAIPKPGPTFRVTFICFNVCILMYICACFVLYYRYSKMFIILLLV